ncbi:MAG: ATPase [Bacteroidales bacterium]|nr:ATPase [Bacteroidales bacterium]
MILIADCGSTKCDWCVTDANGTNFFPGMGFNPVHTSDENIVFAIKSAIAENVVPDTIDKIFFYGAGCIPGEAADKVNGALRYFFPNAEIQIHSDLTGAGRAIFKTDNGIAAILGTGCNSGVYVNGQITENIPPMGYILGDEGSGASIGKRLVNAIYKREIPDYYRELFQKETGLQYSDIIFGAYSSESPAQFLANLVPFIHEHINDTIFRNMVFCEFDLFFNRNIIRLNRPKNFPIGFVGSVAAHFEEILKDAARFHGVTVCSIVQKPIQRLAEYHNEVSL